MTPAKARETTIQVISSMPGIGTGTTHTGCDIKKVGRARRLIKWTLKLSLLGRESQLGSR
jgi:hypothetical protein